MMRENLSTVARRASLGLGLIAAALALSGCGGGESSASPVPSVIDFSSPAVKNGVTDPTVRCGWGSLWLPLKWGAVPEDTKEMAVYIGRYKYATDGGTRKLVVPFANLVSHIDPSQHDVQANVFPEGANWSPIGGLSCPPKAEGQRVLMQLFALDRVRAPRALDYRQAIQLTEEALHASSDLEARQPSGGLMAEALGVGRFTTTFTGPH